MTKFNFQRKSCKDVFNAYLVADATYAGQLELPIIKSTKSVPNKLISFSNSISCKDFNQWIHFYEDDYLFERVWKNPKRYLTLFKRYKGIILPDYSLYRDMPLVMQLWNIYRSRAIGNWLQSNGIDVIPNIRFGDSRTYNICCQGIEKNSTIAIGTHGNLRCIEDRKVFLSGVDNIIRILNPSCIIVYGAAPDKFFRKYKNNGIDIIQFDSSYAISHREVV